MNGYEVDIAPLDPIGFGDNGLGQGRGTGDVLNVPPVAVHGAIGAYILEHCAPSTSWPSELLGERHDDILYPGDTERSAALRGFCFRGVDNRAWFPRPRVLRIGVRHDSNGKPSYRALRARSTLADFGGAVRSSCPYPLLVCGTQDDEVEEGLLISEDLLRAVLCNEATATRLADHAVALGADVLARDHSRMGIEINNETGRGVEGKLFVRRLQRFAPGTSHGEGLSAGYRAWVSLPGELADSCFGQIGRLGGDRRRATLAFSPCEAPLSALKDAVCQASELDDTKGFFLYSLTASVFDPRTLIAGDSRPVAAAIGKPWKYSGWNTQLRQPRPLLTLVPAGACYFFEWPAAADRSALIDRHWLQPLPHESSGQHRMNPVLAGFGRTLVGLWS